LATAERARAQICARQLFQWLNESFAQLSGHEAPAALVASDPGAALCWRPVGGGKFEKAACARGRLSPLRFPKIGSELLTALAKNSETSQKGTYFI
jgi:hypothetical protein